MRESTLLSWSLGWFSGGSTAMYAFAMSKGLIVIVLRERISSFEIMFISVLI